VLEVACGTGYWTPHIARHALRVDAYDINEETLAIARAKPVDTARVSFSQGDAYAPPIATQRHDAAFAGFWWSHVPRQLIARFLEGLHAALAPGARIVCIDNRQVAGSSTPVSRTDEHGNTYQSRVLSDGSRHEVLKNFPMPAELQEAVRPYAAAFDSCLFDYYWWREFDSAAVWADSAATEHDQNSHGRAQREGHRRFDPDMVGLVRVRTTPPASAGGTNGP
jgi:demethylmenaquinone methyltransferase/2-methoxy-6-polyprenyl-1,4-benzoquinol methylase